VLELLHGKVVHIAAGRETGINPLEIEAESDDRAGGSSMSWTRSLKSGLSSR